MNKWVSIAITALIAFVLSFIGSLTTAGAGSAFPTEAQLFWAGITGLGAAALAAQKALEPPPP